MSYGQSGIDHNMALCEKCGEPKADHYLVWYGNDLDEPKKYRLCKRGYELVEDTLEQYDFKERVRA